MNQLWRLLGRISFWGAWPALWVYLHRAQRSRVLVVNSSGQVLVVKGWLSTQKWSLPGGGLHIQEDPRLGAIRETQEEVGIDLTATQLNLLAHQPIKSKGFVVDTWLYGGTVTDAPPLRPQRFEIIDAQWVASTALTARNAEPDVLLALQAWSEAAALVQ